MESKPLAHWFGYSWKAGWWMDTKVVVYVYMEYYSAIKKEWIWVSWSEMGEARTCYTEWSKSEREKQIH